MKKSILIILAVINLSTLCRAQQAPTPTAKEDTITIKLPASKLQELQQVLGYSFQWLPTSDGKAKDVGAVQKAIQELYPLLAPAVVADKPKQVIKPLKK